MNHEQATVRPEVVTDLGNKILLKINQFSKRRKDEALSLAEIGAAMVAAANTIDTQRGDWVLIPVLSELLTDPHMREVALERYAQDEKHGGEENDDRNTFEDWFKFIDDKLEKAGDAIVSLNGTDLPEYRRRMVQVAALAVAAVESLDRQVQQAVEAARAAQDTSEGANYTQAEEAACRNRCAGFGDPPCFTLPGENPPCAECKE